MAKFYVVCDDDCRHEGMTREQILTAIEQAVEQGYVSDPDSAVFSKIKELREGASTRVWVGTEAQFNALDPAPTVNRSFVRVGADGVLYMCTDDTAIPDVVPVEAGGTGADTAEGALLNLGVHVAITKAVNESVTGTHSYSTAETLTGGTWIDGKPIYRKVVQIPAVAKGSTSASGDNPTAIISTDIDTLIDVRGILVRASSTERYVLPEWVSTVDNGYSYHVHFDVRTGAIIVRTGSKLDISGGHVIALYTKK